MHVIQFHLTVTQDTAITVTFPPRVTHRAMHTTSALLILFFNKHIYIGDLTAEHTYEFASAGSQVKPIVPIFVQGRGSN